MSYYSFNLLGAVREAASRLEGEFTSREVARLVREEHPDFGLGDSQLVSNYMAALVREGRLVRVKRPSPRAHASGVYRNAGARTGYWPSGLRRAGSSDEQGGSSSSPRRSACWRSLR